MKTGSGSIRVIQSLLDKIRQQYFYQPQDYFTGDKIKVMRSLYSPFNERIACYYLATMRKAFSMFAWGRSSFNEKILGNVIIRLPISSDGAIDIDFMETFICGTMKLAIRGVVEWKDKEIAATALWFKLKSTGGVINIFCYGTKPHSRMAHF